MSMLREKLKMLRLSFWTRHLAPDKPVAELKNAIARGELAPERRWLYGEAPPGLTPEEYAELLRLEHIALLDDAQAQSRRLCALLDSCRRILLAIFWVLLIPLLISAFTFIAQLLSQ